MRCNDFDEPFEREELLVAGLTEAAKTEEILVVHA
jgi:hypothetical protein